MEAFGTAAALLVDKTDAFLFGVVQSLVGVFDTEGDVVHAAFAAVFLDESGDGAFGAGGFEEFDFHFTDFKEGGFNLLVGYFFNSITFETHDVFPVADSFVKIGHGNADVFNVRRGHNFAFYLLLLLIVLFTAQIFSTKGFDAENAKIQIIF